LCKTDKASAATQFSKLDLSKLRAPKIDLSKLTVRKLDLSKLTVRKFRYLGLVPLDLAPRVAVIPAPQAPARKARDDNGSAERGGV
jgi:hypothetical protein